MGAILDRDTVGRGPAPPGRVRVAVIPAPAARRGLWLLAPILIAVVWFCAPLVFGGRTLVLRDVLNVHLFLRASLGDAIRSGELPLIDENRSGGAPLAGNLNAVPLYPDNLLLAVSDTLWQLNFHFVLHWFVALGGAFRLGRSWGLGRVGAAACATVFASSGYWLSQLNLYNAVAVVALAPWLWSFLLDSGEPGSVGRRNAAGAGAIWGLSVLGGDPFLAAISLGGGLAVLLARRGRAAWRGSLGVALLLGTVVASPQIVETARILPTSYRAVFGYPETHSGARAASTAVELLIPLFFGRPDRLGLWGEELFGGYQPLYYSLAPGAIALALALAAGRPRRRPAWILTAVSAVAVGLVYCGATPLPELISSLPGASAFRFFEKFALVAMIALALAAGAGAERLAAGATRAVVAAAGVVAIPLLALWLGCGADAEVARALFLRVFEGSADATTWQDGRLRWAGLAMFGLAGLVAFGLGIFALRRRSAAAVGVALTLQVVAQSLLLSPLVATDDADTYRRPSPLAASIPRDRVLAHGALTRFTREGDSRLRPGELRPDELPERRQSWLMRRCQAELWGFAALYDRRRLELAVSPEGLDPFVTQALVNAFPRFSDARRVAILRATGVELLVLADRLEPEGAGGARFLAEHPSIRRSIRVYELPDPLPEVALAGSVVRAPHVNAALETIWSRGFDPANVAVIPGEGGPVSAPSGRASIVAASRERVTVEASSPSGGVLILRRAYLPIWKARIDGRPVPTTIAQITRLAVEVPPGRHTVELFVSRGPLLGALGVAALALIGLVALWRSAKGTATAAAGANPLEAPTPVEP
jgi:hypothetical protein